MGASLLHHSGATIFRDEVGVSRNVLALPVWDPVPKVVKELSATTVSWWKTGISGRPLEVAKRGCQVERWLLGGNFSDKLDSVGLF